MAFIGNTVQTQGFTPAIDYFNGNGVTVTFTLSRPIASVAQVIVAIDNVIQNPSSSFTVAGNAITFSSAPLSGTNNIWVEYTSLITTYQAISQDPTVIGDIRATGGYLAEGDFGNSFVDGAILDYVTGRGRVTVGDLDDITFYHGGTAGRSAMMDLYYAGGAKIYGTTALTIPVGTTAQRPTSATGMIRFNTSFNEFEFYNGTSWQGVLSQGAGAYSTEILLVAGGGGSSGDWGGGGGGGGYISSTAVAVPSTSYSIVVGAGGAFGGSNSVPGNPGGDSTAFSQTAVGGGGGGADGGAGDAGTSGGSGGGGAIDGPGGAGTSGQGFAGAAGNRGNSLQGGGGGGASGGGGNGQTGFNGLTWFNGSTYSGGGGGARNGSTASGGLGGGGTGANGSSGGTNGGTNTGGGAGAQNTSGLNGGSGIVVIRYAGAQRGTGGTVASAGGYTYHTFTSSGTYTA